MSIKSIGSLDVAKITLGQVIIDLVSVVKELVENSIDAGSNKIDVTFSNYGIGSVEVSDNGCGIEPVDFDSLCLKHHTSKLSTYEDLTSMHTLGFRGEAMSSLCSVAKTKVSTCTQTSFPKASELFFDQMGKLTSQKTVVLGKKGTTVTVSEIFSGMPVRQKNFVKNAKREYSKALSLLMAYLLAYTEIRFTVFNVSGSTGKKTMAMGTQGGRTSVTDALVSVFGSNGAYGLVPIDIQSGNIDARFKLNMTSVPVALSIKVCGYILDSSFGLGRASTDRQYLTINKRPVTHKRFVKVVNEVYKTFNTTQCPVFVLDLELDTAFVDVNVTPDKRQVLMQSEDVICEVLREELTAFFENRHNVVPKSQLGSVSMGSQVPKRKTETNGDSQASQASQVSLEEVKEVDDEESEEDNDRERESECESQQSEIDEKDERGEDETDVSSGPVSRALLTFIAGSSDSSQEAEVTEERVKLAVRQVTPGSLENKASLRKPSAKLSNCITETDLDLTGAYSLQGGPRPHNSSSLNTGNTGPQKVNEADGFFCGMSDPEIAVEQSDNEVHECEQLSSPTKIYEQNSSISIAEDPGANIAEDVDIDDFHDLQDNELFVDESPPKPRVHKCSESNLAHNSRQAANSLAEGYNSAHTKEGDGQELPRKSTPLAEQLHKLRVKLAVTDLGAQQQVVISEKAPVLRRSARVRAALHDLAETLEIKKTDFAKMEIVGQFNLGFIVVIHQGKLFIVDQHASDEIYNYERLMGSLVLRAQPLVAPRTLELSAIDEMIILEHLPQLRSNGFIVEEVNDGEPGKRVQLVAVPVLKNIVFDDSDLHELVHKLHSHGGCQLKSDKFRNTVRCTKVDSMIALRACRLSIMVGQALNKPTMHTVVKHLSTLDRPWNCPHGRPTMRHLADLEGFLFCEDYEL